MVLARMRRLLLAAGVGAVALAPLALPTAPAHAGQVGVTISIKGAGQVRIVEGELSDGGNPVCDRSDNLDDTHAAECPRIRSESVFEAWVWMRPVNTTDGFTFKSWKGCDVERVRDGVTECMVRAGAFSGIEHHPVVTFAEARAVVSDVRFTQGPDQGRVTIHFANTGASARCSLALNEWQECGDGTSWVLPEGKRGALVSGVNHSGNWGNYVEAPVTVLDTELFRTPPVLTNSRSASLAWLTRSGSSFECSFDAQPFSYCGQASGGAEQLTELTDGDHTWRVRSKDGAWVDPTPAVHTWTVDTVAPVTTLGTTSIDGGHAEIAFSSDDAARHQCRLRSTPAGPDSREEWGACGSPIVYDGLPAGDHVFEVRGVDAAGNAATPVTTAWGTDREPPNTSLTGGPQQGSFRLASSADFTVGVDDETATLSCTLDGRARPCARGPLSLTGLRPGTHTLTVGATDPARNADPTPATRTWTVPYTASAFGRTGTWRAVRTSRAYGGLAYVSTRKDSALARRVTGARRVALVVGGGRGHGVVRVYAGTRLVRTVRLSTASTVARRVVPVTAFRAPFTGRLRVVVASTGKTVRVEGLGVSTR